MKAKPKQSKQFRAAEVRRFLTACADGRVDDVKKYLAEGHDANNHDDLLGDRPLHRAAQNGQVRVARILLANGADIEARVGYGGSERPLDSASDRGYLAMVRFLISKGAKINASGTSSALIAAARHGHLRVIDFLLQKGASQEPDTLYWAVRSGNVKATKALIQSGANVKSVADDNCVSRAAACLVSGAEMLKLLAQHGVDLQQGIRKTGRHFCTMPGMKRLQSF